MNVTGKGRLAQYIARIDKFDETDYEGVLQKFCGCISHHEDLTFIVNEGDGAYLLATNVLFKLPPLNNVSGTSRRANQLWFSFYLSK